MGRGPAKWTEKLIKRRQLEGYGKGEGSAYRPWLEASDISSLGRTRRIHGLKTGRTHHVFSDIENGLLLILEWCADVVDIREQFPLDRAITSELAVELGIAHPTYPGTHVPTVMTADFLVTRKRAGKKVLEAFNAKSVREAEDVRALEKLELQRVYFARCGVRHHIVFDTDIPPTLVANIDWVRAAVPKPGESLPQTGRLDEVATRLLAELAHARHTSTLAGYCGDFDARHGVETGTALRAARVLLHQRRLRTDMTAPGLASQPLAAFRVDVADSPPLRSEGSEQPC